MQAKKALILVDLQNDFCSGGSLAVPDGDAVIPLANRLQSLFDVVIATQDWHPPGHGSFGLWPEHCVQDSHGAELHPQLDKHKIHKVVHKGTHPQIDSYSAFFDNEDRHSTGLEDYLRREGVVDLYIMGLATDYCVKYSCRDAVRLGFKVYLIEDGCRGVGDIERAMQEMRDAGVIVIKSEALY